MTITERIFFILKKRKITQKDFAERIGVNEKTVSAWKNNNSLPPLDKISDISDCLGVSVDYLLTGEEKTATHSNINRQEQTEAWDSFENINNGNTYNGTVNSIVGNYNKLGNIKITNGNSSRNSSSDANDVVLELDEMMRSLDNDTQRELLAAQVHTNIETFKKLLGTSKKNRISKTKDRSKYKYKQYCAW